MRRELQCNCKPILSVKGIKDTRVTGSTTKLDSDKKTQKGKREKEKKKGCFWENRETDGLFSDSLPCQLQVCWRLWFLTGFKEGHFLGSASLCLSTSQSIFLYLSFLMPFCLLCYLAVCMCTRLHVCVYLRISVAVLRQSQKEKARIRKKVFL